MKLVISERRGQLYARVTRNGVIIQVGSDRSTRAEAVGALVLENPRLFNIDTFVDTTTQQTPSS